MTTLSVESEIESGHAVFTLCNSHALERTVAFALPVAAAEARCATLRLRLAGKEKGMVGAEVFLCVKED